jgi:hypothetical protein
MIRRLIATLFLLGAWQAAAGAESGVILARTTPDIVIIWRVNESVSAARQTHPSLEALREALTSQALGVMLRTLPAGAQPKTAVTVKLVYFNDGGYDPNYRIETVSGVRRIGEVASTVEALHRDAKRWQVELAKAHAASGLEAHFEPDAFSGL